MNISVIGLDAPVFDLVQTGLVDASNRPDRIHLYRTHAEVPAGLTYDQYQDYIAQLVIIRDGTPWWIADLLASCEREHGETYYQYAEETGKAPATLYNYVAVVERFPPEERRASLPYSTHAVVAYRPKQERDLWLGIAEKNHWSEKRLRQAVRNSDKSKAGMANQYSLDVEEWIEAGDSIHMTLEIPATIPPGVVVERWKIIAVPVIQS